VQSLTVNGRASQRPWLSGAQLLGGGGPGRVTTTLAYTLANQPNPAWGAGQQDKPPSYPAGPLAFPPGVTPVELTTTPATTLVTTGASTASTLRFDVGEGAEPANGPVVQTISWQAAPPAGVTVSPSSGTAQVAADGTATATVRLSATAGALHGFDAVPITLTSTPQVSLPRLALPIAVVGPGTTAQTCTTLGPTNVVHGLSQTELAGDGVTTPVTVAGQSGRQTVLRIANNLNMYFRVDRRIAFDGNFTATFAIQYLDAGTNSWTLQYDSSGDAYAPALTVTNQGTNTWQTATVTVNDARFAQRENEQTDFRIASASPVTIHSVMTTVSGPGVLAMNLCAGER
jgi:hypothetical protein